MVLWAHTSQYPEWHHDHFSRFCKPHYHDQETNRPTNYVIPSIAIGRVYLVLQCGLITHNMQLNQLTALVQLHMPQNMNSTHKEYCLWSLNNAVICIVYAVTIIKAVLLQWTFADYVCTQWLDTTKTTLVKMIIKAVTIYIYIIM